MGSDLAVIGKRAGALLGSDQQPILIKDKPQGRMRPACRGMKAWYKSHGMVLRASNHFSRHLKFKDASFKNGLQASPDEDLGIFDNQAKDKGGEGVVYYKLMAK